MRKVENACVRARKAARSNKPYKPRDPKLQAIAMETLRATEVAQAASKKAASEKYEAKRARKAAKGVRERHAAAEEAQSRRKQVEDATASGISKVMGVAEQAHQEGREASNTVRIVNERRPPQV
jgi:hypothetical protein